MSRGKAEGGKQLFGVFLQLPRWLVCFRTLSVVLSRAVISFCRSLFLLLLLFFKGAIVWIVDEISHLPFRCIGVIGGPFPLVLGTFGGADFFITPLLSRRRHSDMLLLLPVDSCRLRGEV